MRKRTKEKYWIKKLSELDGILNNQDKADILLVWDRFKPAAMIELSYFSRSKFSRKEFHKKIGDLEKVLEKLNLSYQLQTNYPKRKKEVTRYSYIARNKKKLKEIITADAEKNTKKRRLQVGALLGYPKTAIKAFVNDKTFNFKDLPSKISQKPELKFLNFRLSRHWKEELGYLKKKAEAIKKIAPELYTRIINKKGEP